MQITAAMVKELRERTQAGLNDCRMALMETEAVKGVNFSTRRSTFQHYWSEYRSSIIFTTVLVVLTLAIVLAGQFFEVRAKQRRLVDLDRQIEAVFKETFPEVTRVQAPLQQMQLKIKEARKSGAGSDMIGSRVPVIDLLDTQLSGRPSPVRFVRGAVAQVRAGQFDATTTRVRP